MNLIEKAILDNGLELFWPLLIAVTFFNFGPFRQIVLIAIFDSSVRQSYISSLKIQLIIFVSFITFSFYEREEILDKVRSNELFKVIGRIERISEGGAGTGFFIKGEIYQINYFDSYCYSGFESLKVNDIVDFVYVEQGRLKKKCILSFKIMVSDSIEVSPSDW